MATNKCWAKCLGDCEGKLSNEHLVSEAFYTSNEVTVEGFPWCKNEARKVGLANVTAKILCQKHNNGLSELDSACGHAADVLREQTRLMNIRSTRPNVRWTVKRYEIDGLKLQRWFLKTLINITYGNELKIGSSSKEAGIPSEDLVKICFGQESFTGRAGLYAVVRVGENINSIDKVTVAPLIKDGERIVAGLFTFRGPRFILSLDPAGLPERLWPGIVLAGDDWGNSQLNFHNQEMRMVVGKHLSHVTHYRWN